jgi:hypothetical protein
MKYPSRPETGAARQTTHVAGVEREPADLVADIKAFFVAARSGAKAEEDGRAIWRDNTMKLAKALLAGRELHQNDNNAFGSWLDATGLGEDLISHIDRAALISMAEHAEIAERVLAITTRRSWQHIWREEIAPEVEAKGVIHVNKTPSNPKPNRGGRPRKAPAHSADPIDDVVREAVVNFTGPNAEWRTVRKMASIIGRADVAVKHALTRLGDAVGTRRGANGVDIECRINGERNELLALAGLAKPAPVVEPTVAYWRDLLDAANVKIMELEEQDREKDARITQLEEQVRERDVEIAELKARLGEIGPSSSVAAKADQYVAEQMERLEKEEAGQAAPSVENIH